MQIYIEEIKNYFKQQGCKLLENKYVNAHAKMRYICSCGTKSKINWNNFKNGRRCGCKRKGLQRLTEEEIKKEVESKGYEFISTRHSGLVNLITCRCKCGNIRNCRLSNFRNSSRCKNCLYKDLSLGIEFIKNYFLKNDCELLEKEYKNARKKLKYRCSCGNISKICFDSFRKGNRCRKCGNKKVSKWLSLNRKKDKHPRWIKDREAKRINDSFCDKCRSMVRRTLKLFEQKKENKTEKILGYKFIELKNHIENHKNWPKLKNKNWHIDHIFPLKAFVDYGILDVSLANSLENLQPLPGKENISKSAKYDRSCFENWLESKGFKLERSKIYREIENCGI